MLAEIYKWFTEGFDTGRQKAAGGTWRVRKRAHALCAKVRFLHIDCKSSIKYLIMQSSCIFNRNHHFGRLSPG